MRVQSAHVGRVAVGIFPQHVKVCELAGGVAGGDDLVRRTFVQTRAQFYETL